jgi:hypothetical protein
MPSIDDQHEPQDEARADDASAALGERFERVCPKDGSPGHFIPKRSATSVNCNLFAQPSGNVITGMIHREHSSTGRFRLGQFYRRRFKRLTPALARMVAVTIGLVLLPTASVRRAPDSSANRHRRNAAGGQLRDCPNTGGFFHALPPDQERNNSTLKE